MIDLKHREFINNLHPGVILNSTQFFEDVVHGYSDDAKPSLTFGYSIKSLSVAVVTVKNINTFEMIDIDEIKKNFFPDVDESLIFEQFRSSLWQDVVENKISKIKFYRIINKLTQVKLAEMLGTSQPDVARFEKKGHSPGIKTLKKLAKIFNVDLAELA